MNQAEFQVLLVEGDRGTQAMLSQLLHQDHITPLIVPDVEQALEVMRERRLDLVLLDLKLTGGDPFDFLRKLPEDPSVQPAPVAVLGAADDLQDKLRAFELGAVDYIIKSADGAEIRARIRVAIRARRREDKIVQQNRELTAARVAAETAVRAKTVFLASMSHEIRTPMNGVIATVAMLMGTHLTAEQRGYLETIHSSSDALLTLINDILDFSKIEAGKLELNPHPFNLRACVEESVDLMAVRAFEKDLDLVCEIGDEIPNTIECDPFRLRQVLANMLSNAIKFTKAGDVSVQVQAVSSSPDGDGLLQLNLQFSIRDSGVGIPADRLSRLFKPFTQAEASTAQKFGGSGLGLAISKRLVELMGGKIWAESLPEQGSTFHFTIAASAQANAAPYPLSGRQDKLAGLRVLIVDDNQSSRGALSGLTARWGMTPVAVENAQEAVEALGPGALFDLAILDAQMPGADGFTLAGKIHQLQGMELTPIVLLVPPGVRLDAPSAPQIPFINYARKPVKPAQLFEKLYGALTNVKASAEKAVPPPNPETPIALQKPLQILVCDDNAINQKVAARILQQLGYKPDVAENGREALDALEKKRYDMVFMDVMMPEMDGLEATREIRKREQAGLSPNLKPPLVVIAMTAQAMQGDREKCIAAGMDDYLSKPIRPKDIREIIEKWHTRLASAETRTVSEPPGGPDREESPVEMDRITDLTGNDAETLRELVDLHYKQTTEHLEKLLAAVRANKAEDVRHLAHSCKGASATVGMARLAAVFFELEKMGKAGMVDGAAPLLEDAAREFKRAHDFLAAQPALARSAMAVHS